jgi:L-cysteine/cystine lyase
MRRSGIEYWIIKELNFCGYDVNSSIAQYRQQIPALDRYAYFNYGGQGLLSTAAIAAINQAQVAVQELAPFSLAANDWIKAQTIALRSLMATELGAPSDTITLTENTTVGCNIALWGIDWRVGDRVLITDCEQQGIIATVDELQHRFGIEIDVCPVMATLNPTVNQSDPIAVIKAAITPRTRMLVLSHVLWNTGQVLPLAEIVAVCRSRGVMVTVDAAQSVGMLPLDLTALAADFYAFTGHKWWCGPAGLGGLYVRPEMCAVLRPTFVGWRSVILDAHGKPTRFKPNAERYEVATAAVPLYAGLQTAIAQHRDVGSAQTRYDLIADRAQFLWQQLQTVPTVQCLADRPTGSGLVAFQLETGQHKELVQFLEDQKIYVRLLLDPNCVRAGVHYFSSEAEIEQLVRAIGDWVRSL